ncbi:MAG: energy-coupling factor transporter transmembrane component T family protein [Lachnospiraceae bacterium]
MIKDITLGQYYPADSLLHRLDPRVKLGATFLFVISLFLVKGIPSFLLVTLGLFTAIGLSKVPFSFMVRGLRAIVVLLVLTSIFNLFQPGTPLIKIWIFTITKEGVKQAVLLCTRLIYLILGTSVMTLTTTPNQLTDGLETALRVFQKIGVPVHELAMTMSIALRFIPILMEETNRIQKAQMARGADFESGNLIQRIKRLVPLIIPLFVSAFRRANDLALAMESRCYHGSEGRTRMKPLCYQKADHIAYVVLVLYFAGVVLLRIFM